MKKQLRVTIESGRARPLPPLGPMLGQRGINIREVCNTFNLISSSYIDGVPLVTNIVTTEGSITRVSILGIALPFLIHMYTINKSISTKSLYRISAFVKQYDKRYEQLGHIQLFTTLLGSCNSANITVLN